jgi:hypothetical protein
MTSKRLGLITASLMVATRVAAASSDITYDVSESNGTESLVGTIITDGTIGPITSSDIVYWHFDASGPATTFSESKTDSGAFISPQPPTALFDASSESLSLSESLMGAPAQFANGAVGVNFSGIAVDLVSNGGQYPIDYRSFSASAVPLPPSCWLLLSSIGGLVMFRHRGRASAAIAT